jgi:hypothetical protein
MIPLSIQKLLSAESSEDSLPFIRRKDSTVPLGSHDTHHLL